MSHFGYFAYHLHQLELVLWHFNSWKDQAADPTFFQSDPEWEGVGGKDGIQGLEDP